MSNRMKELWSKNEYGIGLWCTFDDPKITNLAAHAGFDYLTVDLQHGFNTWANLNETLRALHGSEPTVLVRVPANREEFVTRALDAGADGVVVPMVESAEDAKLAVDSALYPSVDPSLTGGRRSFGPLWADYDASMDTDAVNRRTVVAVQIETAKGLENVREIAAVPGVSALYVGPYDLALSLGYGGQTYRENAVIHEAIDHVIAVANEFGLAMGMHCNGPEMAAYWKGRGALMLTSALDTTTVSQAFTSLATDVKAHADAVPQPILN